MKVSKSLLIIIAITVSASTGCKKKVIIEPEDGKPIPQILPAPTGPDSSK